MRNDPGNLKYLPDLPQAKKVTFTYITLSLLFLAMVLTISCKKTETDAAFDTKTYANPMDISYRFGIELPSRREAADPCVVWFKDRYYLFASKSGGYWHSSDLVDWLFVKSTRLPVEEYAPAAVVLGDTLFFLASSIEKSTVYKSTDLLNDAWSVAVDSLNLPVWDPAFLLDDDDRLYLYWGCSDVNPLYGVEVDPDHDFSFMSDPVVLMKENAKEYGWEVPGDYNTLVEQRPWIEGAWVTKHGGRYYLQYSGPGTEYKSYADAMYVSDNPLGPFTLQTHNPYAYKPSGFAAGAGHGGTFADRYGNLWQAGTMTISQKHMFERRLGLFPAFLDADGILHSSTKFGDYPMKMPRKKVSSFEDIFTGWMLLSYGKKVQVSSAIDSLPPGNITDENIRTYWAATSGSAQEYAMIDLGEAHDVYAVQINFYEHETNLLGRNNNKFHRYTLEYSQEGSSWQLLIDKSNNTDDNTHDYMALGEMVACRYLRINNVEVPDGNFAICGFRIFGKGNGAPPAQPKKLKATRNKEDRRSVTLTWENSADAIGYNINFGVDEQKLYNHYMIYEDTTVVINSLNVHQPYFFNIESFNANGVSKSEEIILVP